MKTRASNTSQQDFMSIWALPLAAGLLPAVAAVAAFLISAHSGLISPCNPILDGCVSISRAARHELANLVFRALVLPGATLQGLTWVMCAQWLGCIDAAPGKTPRALATLGVLAGLFFVLYGAFLGSEGETYQWLRRYGINFYFGLTYLCMLLTSARVFQLAQTDQLSVPLQLHRALGVLCLTLLVFGLSNLLTKSVLDDEALVDRIENSLEWLAGLLFTLFFVMLSWLWHHTRFRLHAGTET
jgi:hypothetical protein